MSYKNNTDVNKNVNSLHNNTKNNFLLNFDKSVNKGGKLIFFSRLTASFLNKPYSLCQLFNHTPKINVTIAKPSPSWCFVFPEVF